MLPYLRFSRPNLQATVLVTFAIGGVTAIGVLLDGQIESLSHIYLYVMIVSIATLLRGPRLALYAFVLSVLAILLFFVLPHGVWRIGFDGYDYRSDALSLGVFVLVALFVSYLISIVQRERDRAHALAEGERAAKEAVLQATAERERAASLEERNRLARDLHDSLAQTINYIGLKMELLRELSAAGETAQIQEEIERVSKAAERARSDVREVLYGLRHTERDRAIIAEMADIVHRVAEQSGLPIQFTVDTGQEWPALSVATHIQLLRIVQEALTNAAIHAHATQAEVEARYDPKGQILSIYMCDDGVGFVPASVRGSGSQHLGLRIMHERAARLPAQLTITSQPGAGTQIQLTYTLSGADAIPPERATETIQESAVAQSA